jgi:hypothetical protein
LTRNEHPRVFQYLQLTLRISPRYLRGSVMRCASIGFALVALSQLALANASSVLAQSGSTGGTIGKQDKSVSGGDEADGPHAAPRSKPSATPKVASSGSSCSRIIGTWKWGGGLGLTKMVFDQNGTVRQTLTGSAGSWSCASTIVKTVFANGSTDRITISRDGNSLSVTTTWGGGSSFKATRLE